MPRVRYSGDVPTGLERTLGIYKEAQVEEGAGQSVRAHFGALVVFILIPGLLIAGWLAYLSVKSERAQIELSAMQRAREIVAAIDRESGSGSR